MMYVLGFGGSAFVVMSVTMRSVVWLRSFGLAGSLMFIAYGATSGAWPVVATNVATTSIHVYQLGMLGRTPDQIRVGGGWRLGRRRVSPRGESVAPQGELDVTDDHEEPKHATVRHAPVTLER